MRAALVIVVAAAALLPTLVARADRTLEAQRPTSPIQIDGRLDEAAWEAVEASGDFVERTPTPGAEPPARTTVRVLYDDEALYVGLVMELVEGETPRGLSLTRDSFRLYSDDAITVKIDVAHDHRTTIGFAVNPSGTQLDYVAVENGQQFRAEYDAVWESATRVTTGAWIAELRIPVEALGLADEEGPRVLGLNVTRDHNATHAVYDWSHIPPEFGPVSALHYGELHVPPGLGGGTPLTLIPYGLVGWNRERTERGPVSQVFRWRAGGDARLRIGDDVWSELTVLTDFAQVDLDDQVVNLNRFPLFLPEKRPFFLTGLDVFEFGDQGNAQLFFSRRIGLDAEGEPVPLWGGLKVYGRSGPVGFGLLDVVTDDPNRHWGVGRLRVNVGESAYVGVMATARNDLSEDRSGDPSHRDAGYAFGVDGRARAFGERLEVSASASATEGPGPDPAWRDRSSGLVSARWRGEVLQPSASMLYVGDEFDPDMGFVLRQGILRSRLAVPVVHRTEAHGLQQITVTPSGRWDATDELDARLGAEGELALNADFGGWSFATAVDWQEDIVLRSFELLPGVLVVPGVYRGVGAEYSLTASSRRNPSGTLAYRGTNAFFGGVLHSVSATGAVNAGPHLRLAVGADQSFIDIPGFEPQRVLTVNSVLTVAPSTSVTADLVFQVNDVEESTVGLFRLRWRYLPGSDLFLVYRQDVTFDGVYEGEATLKATWRYDALL